jgi:hypothetical protein
MDSLEQLFCHIDDFCQQFELKWHSLLLGEGMQHRQRQRSQGCTYRSYPCV